MTARRQGLLLRFGLLSAVLIALLIGSTGLVVQHLIANRTRASASSLAAADIQFIAGLGLKQITTSVDAQSAQQLQEEFRSVALTQDFVGADAFTPGTGTVVFSDIASFTGTTEPTTPELLAAGQGRVTSRLVEPGGSGRLADLTARKGTVLAVYVPIKLLGVRVAVVAFYLRWAPYAAAIRHDTLVLAMTLVIGGVLFYLALFRLFSQASRRLRRESRINAVLANHDPLTGLWNRPGLAAAVEPLLRGPAALMLVDLDRFKDVNDTLGHRHGDLLLAAVAGRMSSVLGTLGEVGRIGGDEFAVVLRSAEGATDVADSLLAELRRGFDVDGAMLDVDASIGVVRAPDHGDDFAALLQHADVAMYAAKAGGGGWVVYDPSSDPNTTERLNLVGELRRALDTDEMQLWYQPLVGLSDASPPAAEALVRWNHPTRGLVMPDAFMAVAEETGLVRRLTSVVLRQALDQARRWALDGCRVQVSVNVSARCVLDDGLVDEVHSLLTLFDIPGDQLTIELTESGVLHDPGRARRVLAGLVGLGVHLSLDDFGTGHSSLAHLQMLPLTEVKIDRTFVRDVATSPRDAAIVGACVQLAASLGLRTVAEGVEDAAALAKLRDLGVTAVQGWYLSAAVLPDHLLEFFRTAQVR